MPLLSGVDKYRLKAGLDVIDSWLGSLLSYLLMIVLAFGFGAAVFSFLSGGRSSTLLTTQAGTNMLTGIVVVAVIVIWREVRELRRWLESVSKGKAGAYSRLREKEKRRRGG